MIIRKLIIGSDVKNGLAFSKGQVFELFSNGVKSEHVIHDIIKDEACVKIYVKNIKDNAIFLWKEVSNNSNIVIEFDINF